MNVKKSFLVLALGITMSGCSSLPGASASENTVQSTTQSVSESRTINLSEENPIISGAGTYTLTGTLKDETVVVDAGSKADITLVLDNVNISNSKGSAIVVTNAKSVTIVLQEGSVNTLEDGGYSVSEDGVNAALYSEVDLNISGTGTLVVNGNVNHGIYTKDDLLIESADITVNAANDGIKGHDGITIQSGTFTIDAQDKAITASRNNEKGLADIEINGGDFSIQAEDGIKATGQLTVNAGNIDITNCSEGLEGQYITINDGTVSITASDDGINASDPNATNSEAVQDAYIEINGGNITVDMGSGDTDAIDSNGDLIVTGGTIDITAQSGFDYNGSSTFSAGTITLNGQKVTSLQNSMMGGSGMKGGRSWS